MEDFLHFAEFNEYGERRERVDRKEEMLKSKGLWFDPEYRPRTEEEMDILFPVYPSSELPCDVHNLNSCKQCNYKLSFDSKDSNGYISALQTYGMCIIRLMDQKQCKETVKEMFEEFNQSAIELHGEQEQTISPDHPASWEKCNWPAKGKFLVRDPAFTQQAFENRTSEALYEVYCNIFGRDDLYCSIDNWGLFRGTKDLIFTKEEFNRWREKRLKGRKTFEALYRKEHNQEPPEDDMKEKYNPRFIIHEGIEHVMMDRPDWRHNLKPHWDLNPWKWLQECDNNEPHLYQSLVALKNCPEPVGGFACLPGSHIFVKEWCSEHKKPHNKRKTTRVPDGDPILERIQRIPLRSGEMVIWNTALVHCNFPNFSNEMRLIQFLRMLPQEKINTDKDRYCATRILHHFPAQKLRITTTGDSTDPEAITLSPLGLRLLGINESE